MQNELILEALFNIDCKALKLNGIIFINWVTSLWDKCRITRLDWRTAKSTKVNELHLASVALCLVSYILLHLYNQCNKSLLCKRKKKKRKIQWKKIHFLFHICEMVRMVGTSFNIIKSNIKPLQTNNPTQQMQDNLCRCRINGRAGVFEYTGLPTVIKWQLNVCFTSAYSNCTNAFLRQLPLKKD